MPNFSKPTTPVFPADIAIIEEPDPVLGGGELVGPNKLAKPLSDRTLWLKTEIENLVANSQNLIIGDDVQAWAKILDEVSDLEIGDNGLIRRSGTTANPVISGVKTWVNNQLVGGRLSLVSGEGFGAADITGTRIYYTPFNGNVTAIYKNSSNEWVYHQQNEISVSLAGLAANTLHDVFLQSTNGGTPTLAVVAWASATTRAVVLALQDGVRVAANNLERRYLGTFRTTSAGTTADTQDQRFLWNAHNRQPKIVFTKLAGTGNFPATNTTWQPFNGDTSLRVGIVSGLPVSLVDLNMFGFTSNGCILGIGVNSTTAATSLFGQQSSPTSASGAAGSLYREIAPAGYSFYQMLQLSKTGNSTISIPDSSLSGVWYC